MEQMDRATLEALVRSIVMEKLGALSCPVKKLSVPDLDVTEEHRMDTGNPADRVWTRDLLTLEESPRLGCGQFPVSTQRVFLIVRSEKDSLR